MPLRSLLRPLAEAIQRIVWRGLDNYERLRGSKHPMAPPRHMMNVGSASYTRSDFHSIGSQLLSYLKQYAELKADDIVLDVGCGVGRMAIALNEELNECGRYEGFDIVSDSVNHCKNEITTRNPAMRFVHADVFNSYYNPLGRHTAETYQFPYPDNHFSLVLLTSVFTHMLSDGLENYLREIHRVLQPGGRCFITFFLLNEHAELSIAQRKASIPFEHPVSQGKSSSLDSPEAAIAFNESYIRQLYDNLGLEVQEPVLRGSWCHIQSSVGLQDVIVAVKKATASEHRT